MRARAYAKVNLGLEVLFRREDGYHELRTILQTVDLCDELVFQRTPSGVELEVDDPAMPTGEDNLVVRAARALADRLHRRDGARIRLRKRIPAARGLGGGSADAAMALLALNELWEGGLTTAELHPLAAKLGADVPFFLYGGTALAVGRGDEVFPLAEQGELPILLILPEFGISTAECYRNLMLTKKGSSLKLQSFAWAGLDVKNRLRGLTNDLEAAAREQVPSINEYKQILLDLGAVVSLMSGSGSAVFGIFDDEASARSGAKEVSERGIRVIATHTLTREVYRTRRLGFEPGRFGDT